MGSETHDSRTAIEVVEPDGMPSISLLNGNGDVILSVLRVDTSDSLWTLIQMIRGIVGPYRVSLISARGALYQESLTIAENGISSGDNITVVVLPVLNVYAIPLNADCIFVYDTLMGEVSQVDTTFVATGAGKWDGAVVSEGKIYAIPSNAECMLIYDTRTGEVSHVDTTVAATGWSKWEGAVVFKGKIYAIPLMAECMLVYDTVTGQVSHLPTTAVATGGYKWGCAVVSEGKIYAIPSNAECMLIYDTQTGQFSQVDTTTVATGVSKC